MDFPGCSVACMSPCTYTSFFSSFPKDADSTSPGRWGPLSLLQEPFLSFVREVSPAQNPFLNFPFWLLSGFLISCDSVSLARVLSVDAIEDDPEPKCLVMSKTSR